MLLRENYLDKIQPYMNKKLIKVLTGQRRVGKTVILSQLIDKIKRQDAKANIIYINKEHNDFKHIKTADDLYQYIKSNVNAAANNYVLVDEIQEVEAFEMALRQLLLEDIDIYCTGSNAKMLSGDLATHLSGRFIEFHINSLSYSEFMQMHGLGNSNDVLNLYIRYGGLPYLSHLELNDEVVYGYLKSIYNTIILKDIVARYNIRDIDFLERLIEYLSDNLGSYVSS